MLNGDWCKSIGNLLNEIDMFNIYEDKSSCNLILCKEALEAKFRGKWRETVQQKTKLRSYILWKENFNTKTYVSLNLPRSHRSILAQIRSGILPLEIETGRFRNIKFEDRKCKICNSESIESVIQFLLICRPYEINRRTFFNKIGVNITENTPNNIMKMLFSEFPRALAKFCTKLWTNRKISLFPKT